MGTTKEFRRIMNEIKYYKSILGKDMGLNDRKSDIVDKQIALRRLWEIRRMLQNLLYFKTKS